jgi:hypothetical protein
MARAAHLGLGWSANWVSVSLGATPHREVSKRDTVFKKLGFIAFFVILNQLIKAL